MKVALFENYAQDFLNYRLRLAKYIKSNGVEVIAVLPKDEYQNEIKLSGIEVLFVDLDVRKSGLLNKFKYAYELNKIIRKRDDVDIFHFFRLQPNIIGTFVAGINGKRMIINHVTGLGKSFSNDDFKNKILQSINKLFYKVNSVLFKPVMIFQNTYDPEDLGIKKKVRIIKGSAVDQSKFKVASTSDNKDGDINFLYVSRLLKDKGIIELALAFKKLKLIARNVSLTIIGYHDQNNSNSVSSADLCSLIEGCDNINFLGKKKEIQEFINRSNVCILPTIYREGTPRFLLEAMASSRPIITTNRPGCDHLIVDKKNGVLMNDNSVNSIVNAVLEIIQMDLKKMGEESRGIYMSEFCEEIVYQQIFKEYEKIFIQ